MAMTFTQARDALMRLKGADGGRRQWGAFTDRSSYDAGGLARAKNSRPGFFDTQYGVAPNDAEAMEFWKAMGGGPKQPRPVAPAKTSPSDLFAAYAAEPRPAAAPAAQGAPGSRYASLVRELAAAEQRKVDEANAANEARFARIDQSKGDLYGRVMGEVDNWGNVQSQLNQETTQRQIDQITADMAERGLANSNAPAAAKMQAQRNLALVQQDLSERKSDRRIGYDVNLTNDRDAFVERKYDNAPDSRDLMAIYAKLGEAEAMDRARAEAAARSRSSGGRRRSGRRLPPIQSGGGVSPAYAQMLAASTQGNFLGGIAGGMNFLRNFNNLNNYRPAWTSNAYPYRRGESRDSAYARRMNG